MGVSSQNNNCHERAILTTESSVTGLFATMDEQMPDVNEYARSLIKAVLGYTGTQDKLTTIVCMTCGENFTSSFPDVNGTVPCGNLRMWQWAYPYGGDIYVYISCYKCSKEYSQQTI
jgi:hypothetical protein